MRFFLECVTCCGSPAEGPVVERQPFEEEERTLVPSTSQRRRRRKRGRLGVSVAAEWRPSLGSISEDNVVPQKSDPRMSTVGSPREGKRMSGSGVAVAAAKLRHRYYGDNFSFRRATVPSVMPAFSPTPFMF